MVDPQSGIKIYRYCNETTEKMKEYQTRRKQLFDKISTEFAPSNSTFTKLVNRFKLFRKK
jgi:hypothetical protein